MLIKNKLYIWSELYQLQDSWTKTDSSNEDLSFIDLDQINIEYLKLENILEHVEPQDILKPTAKEEFIIFQEFSTDGGNNDNNINFSLGNSFYQKGFNIYKRIL